jgi:hypothetical protein
MLLGLFLLGPDEQEVEDREQNDNGHEGSQTTGRPPRLGSMSNTCEHCFLLGKRREKPFVVISNSKFQTSKTIQDQKSK